jgi:hypothetical protein
MEKTKLWKVENNELLEMTSSDLDFEERIHEWIEKDLSIILPNAILIGSKIKTDHGKELDLLAIDENGDLIIIELKRGLTPRDITAQALEYASWVATLDIDNIDSILSKRGIEKSILELLSEEFDNSEDIDINENQKIYIVATSVDFITERICKYLAKNGLKINVITFSYYQSEAKEFIARNVLVTDNIPQKESVKKRSGRYTTRLFNEEKLKVGQKIKYLPLEERGVELIATIYRSGSKCLKLENSKERYSFSGLRKKLILEHELELNPYFPYYQWGEWFLIDESLKLSEL